jgi:UDP-glucose 4-epimerase
MPVNPINVYGRTKAMVEQILHDLYQAQPQFNIAILRYFNPVGAHPSGMIGDDPLLQPNNLMPMMSQIVANDDDGVLKVFGSDYPTPDGTAQRDYIHVQDLIAGHMCALHVLNNRQSGPPMTLNLGTGRPYSVLEMLRTFEEASQKKIPYQMAPRREGDSPCSYADVTLAKKILGWEATLGIDRMCKDSWRFQRGVSVDRYLIGK